MGQALITRRGGGTSGGMYAWKKSDYKRTYIPKVTSYGNTVSAMLSVGSFSSYYSTATLYSDYTIDQTNGTIKLTGTKETVTLNSITSSSKYCGWYYTRSASAVGSPEIYKIYSYDGDMTYNYYFLRANEKIESQLDASNTPLGYVVDDDNSKYPVEGLGADGYMYMGTEKVHWAKGEISVSYLNQSAKYSGKVIGLSFRPKIVYIYYSYMSPHNVLLHDSYDTSLPQIKLDSYTDLYSTTVRATMYDNGFEVFGIGVDYNYESQGGSLWTVNYVAFG